MKLTAIAFDGDDTLWHNEPLFWASTQAFLQELAPYAAPDHLAERLTATQIANLAMFGYGIKGFVLSMIETALQVSGGQVANGVIQDFLDRGKDMLAHPVHLLDGIAQAVAAARARDVTVMLITKGDLFDQESKLARSGLADLFHVVEIVSDKTTDTYARLLARHGHHPENTVMVGNSVRSDILPMIAIGGWAVHVPYASTWVHEQADAPMAHPRYRSITALAQLAAILDEISGL